MTLFIDVDHVARLFATVGIRRAIREMADYIEADYSRWAQFDKSPRTANHSAKGVIELMPTDDGQRYSFKYVNGHPDNGQSNLLTVMAFGVLADVHSGYPTLLSELTLTTAVRTAATSALVAKSLARPDARIMAIIGNGAQSEFQALAFHEMLSIKELRIFDIDRDASLKLKRNLAAFPDLEVILAGSAQEAVKGADIVTTVTADKAYATILTPEMIEPGMHINAVGGTVRGKPSCTPRSCVTPGSSLNLNLRPGLKVTSSNWKPTFPSSNFSGLFRAKSRAARTTLRSLCSIRWVLPSKTFRHCAMYWTWPRSMQSVNTSTWCRGLPT